MALEMEDQKLTWTRFFWAQGVYTPDPAAALAARQRKSVGLHPGRSEMPICCDPKVMRFLMGGVLYLSTYARKNWPPVDQREALVSSKEWMARGDMYLVRNR